MQTSGSEGVGVTSATLSMATAQVSQAYGAALSAAAERVTQQQQDAYAAYVRQVQDLQRELAERMNNAVATYWQHITTLSTTGESVEACVNAYRTYIDRLQQLLREPVHGSEELKAYASLIRGLAELPPGADGQQRGPEILRESAETLRRLWERGEQREAAQQAFNEYAARLQALQRSVNDGLRGAQERLVTALRDAWTQTDVDGRGSRILQDYVGAARQGLEELHGAVSAAANDALTTLRGGGGDRD